MKEYFYLNGTTQLGPFTLEELKEEALTRDTKIWYQGLTDWTVAEGIPELADSFQTPPKVTPPDAPKPTVQTVNRDHASSSGQPPKTYLLESILVTLFCCLPLGIVGIVSASSVESKFYANDIEGAKLASQTAKKWVNLSVIIGLVCGFIYFLFLFVSFI